MHAATSLVSKTRLQHQQLAATAMCSSNRLQRQQHANLPAAMFHTSQSWLQGEQATWVKLSAIKSNCGIELCLDECLKQLEGEDRAARKAEAEKRQQAGLRPSRAAEEGAAAVGPEAADAHQDNAPVSAAEEDEAITGEPTSLDWCRYEHHMWLGSQRAVQAVKGCVPSGQHLPRRGCQG